LVIELDIAFQSFMVASLVDGTFPNGVSHLDQDRLQRHSSWLVEHPQAPKAQVQKDR
jgi:hypothetical protein